MSALDCVKCDAYLHLGIARLAERLHRLFLDVIRVELDRMHVHDINATQALLLLHLPDGRGLSVRDILESGCYLGSNPSYNTKNLIACGYIFCEALQKDKRWSVINLSELGLEVKRKLLCAIGAIETEEDLGGAIKNLKSIEQAWKTYNSQIALR